jgi:acylphosphatase
MIASKNRLADHVPAFETWVSLRMTVARRFIVSGRVQGVGFRYFAIRAARQTGVVGTVRNLPDGTVEAIAEGSQDSVAEFRRALERGPSYGNVLRVDEIEMQPSGRYAGFDVVF